MTDDSYSKKFQQKIDELTQQYYIQSEELDGLTNAWEIKLNETDPLAERFPKIFKPDLPNNQSRIGNFLSKEERGEIERQMDSIATNAATHPHKFDWFLGNITEKNIIKPLEKDKILGQNNKQEQVKVLVDKLVRNIDKTNTPNLMYIMDKLGLLSPVYRSKNEHTPPSPKI